MKNIVSVDFVITRANCSCCSLLFVSVCPLQSVGLWRVGGEGGCGEGFAARCTETMLFQRWPIVFNAGPTLKQQCVNVSCFLGWLL